MNDHQREAALGLLGLKPLVPLKRAHEEDDISCICGFSYDDGFSIACDDCSRWCHAACFDIVDGDVPEEWRCWVCVPRPVDKDRAVKLQRARLSRRSSPPLDRKHRRASAAEEPASLSYVHIPHDIIPSHETREKLTRQAQHWRGITALDEHRPQTVVRPLPPNPAPSPYTNPSVLPPAYALHTSTSIPSDQLIASYTSTITPSSSYLSDPLNSYAHLGIPKPFVHLIGPPLNLALDSRIAGNTTRFVRNGCRPNAVLRPFLCPRSQDTLSFGVFALRDLKANEQVILGWEWDDGHVIHHLPALIESPHIFPTHDSISPEKIEHIRHQMSNILHALSSTFTTCACGARAKNCAIMQMAAFVDGEMLHSPHVDLGPLVGTQRGFKTKERVPFSGGLSGMEMYHEESGDLHPNPIVIVSPASPAPPEAAAAPKTMCLQCSPMPHDRPPDPDGDGDPRSPQVDQVQCEDRMPPKMRKKWIHRESEALRESNARNSESPATTTVLDLANVPGGAGLGIRMGEITSIVSDPVTMPPPPLPSDISSSTSPSSSFARLSIISPVIPGLFNAPPSSWSPLTRTPQSIVDEVDSFLVPNPPLRPPPTPASPEATDLDEPPDHIPSPSPPPLTAVTLPDEQSMIEEPPLSPPAAQDEAHDTNDVADPPPLPPISSPAMSAASFEMLTPKVKMSLKDFAIRKRKQREEEKSKGGNVFGGGDPEASKNSEEGEMEMSGTEAWPHESELGPHESELQTNKPVVPFRLPRFVPISAIVTETREAKQEQIEPTITASIVVDPRRVSHEDGEISSSASSSATPPLVGKAPPSRAASFYPRSHTPPTQPRSFNASPSPSAAAAPTASTSTSTSTSSTVMASMMPRRPSIPPFRSPLISNSSPVPGLPSTSASSAAATSSSNVIYHDYLGNSIPSSIFSSFKPIPSGPRALRAVNSQPLSTPPPAPPPALPPPPPIAYRSSPSSSSSSFSGSSYIPRGPSADRERIDRIDRMDWERERAWQRSRVRGPGWR